MLKYETHFMLRHVLTNMYLTISKETANLPKKEPAEKEINSIYKALNEYKKKRYLLAKSQKKSMMNLEEEEYKSKQAFLYYNKSISYY